MLKYKTVLRGREMSYLALYRKFRPDSFDDVKGQEHVVTTLKNQIANGRVGHAYLLCGTRGTGKTTIAKALAKSVEADFARIQLTPDTLPTDIIGTSIFSAKDEEFKTVKGPIFCNILLADEINRTSTKTQSALLEVMEEGQVTVDGVTRQLPVPFIVMATQNPVGSAGTQMLPESQLDRFMIRISMGYPSMEEELRLIKERQDTNPLDSVREIISKKELVAMQEQVRQIHVDDKVLVYLSRIVDGTRNHAMLSLGVSPRGTLALMDMARACAYVAGRAFVLPEDVKNVSVAVLAHRILLNGKARMAHVTEEDVIEEIVNHVPAPKLA
jgi:MoxR-like ATPase